MTGWLNGKRKPAVVSACDNNGPGGANTPPAMTCGRLVPPLYAAQAPGVANATSQIFRV